MVLELPKINIWVLIVTQDIILFILAFIPSLMSDFKARKVCHAVMGMFFLLLDP